MPRTPRITALAAMRLREAMTAAQTGDTPLALSALMAIDTESWAGIKLRLNELGPELSALIADSLAGVR